VILILVCVLLPKLNSPLLSFVTMSLEGEQQLSLGELIAPNLIAFYYTFSLGFYCVSRDFRS